MVHSRLLQTIARLDLTAATNPETQRLLSEASRTIHVGSDTAFTIVGDVTKVFTSAVGVITQLILLRHTINRSNVDLIGIGFAANLIRSASWLFRGGKIVILPCIRVPNEEGHQIQGSGRHQPSSTISACKAYGMQHKSHQLRRFYSSCQGIGWISMLKPMPGLDRSGRTV